MYYLTGVFAIIYLFCFCTTLFILYGLEVYGSTYASYLDKKTTVSVSNKILRIGYY